MTINIDNRPECPLFWTNEDNHTLVETIIIDKLGVSIASHVLQITKDRGKARILLQRTTKLVNRAEPPVASVVLEEEIVLVMRDEEIVLDDGVAGVGVEAVRPGLGVAAGQPEQPAPANHRHLPHAGEHRVPPQYGDRAPVVLPLDEGEVHGHEQRRLLLGGEGVESLSPADEPRGQLRPQSHGVVHHHHHAERGGRRVRRGGLRHAHRARARPADHVVPVEPQVAQLLAHRLLHCSLALQEAMRLLLRRIGCSEQHRSKREEEEEGGRGNVEESGHWGTPESAQGEEFE
ncbi:unnamed protein product, partial [Musa hybrid cultivar]